MKVALALVRARANFAFGEEWEALIRKADIIVQCTLPAETYVPGGDYLLASVLKVRDALVTHHEHVGALVFQ